MYIVSMTYCDSHMTIPSVSVLSFAINSGKMLYNTTSPMAYNMNPHACVARITFTVISTHIAFVVVYRQKANLTM